MMSTMEDVALAESKMNAAQDALMKYIEARGPIDRERHRRLVARLKSAQAAFLKAVSELGN